MNVDREPLRFRIGPAASICYTPPMGEACTILLLEDEYNDIGLFLFALGKLKRKTSVDTVRNVAQAREFISRKLAASAPPPNLILIDIGLAHESGLEFIRWCKSDPRLQRVHIIVFSGSTDSKDRTEAFKLGASAFETKPLEMDDLIATLSRLIAEWCD